MIDDIMIDIMILNRDMLTFAIDVAGKKGSTNKFDNAISYSAAVGKLLLM